MNQAIKKSMALGMVLLFLTQNMGLSSAYGQTASINTLTPMSYVLDPIAPIVLRGLKVDQANPFHFEFIVDSGKSGLSGEPLKAQSRQLIRYFLAALTVPENDLWVNLAPQEKDRIIPDQLATTEMGRELLNQDYLLKQLASSLTDPQTELGKKYWQLQNTTIPQKCDALNRIWIVPDRAVVYQNAGTAFIGLTHLKVLLKEEDHVSPLAFRQIILPEIEKQVNENKNFAPLRQVYHSLILAAWYKRTLKQSLLSQVYVDKNKMAGVDLADKNEKQQIYEQYLKAFGQGAYNVIQEEEDSEGHVVPRKYFSGGVQIGGAIGPAIAATPLLGNEAAALAAVTGPLVNVQVDARGVNAPSAISKVEEVIKFQASLEISDSLQRIFEQDPVNVLSFKVSDLFYDATFRFELAKIMLKTEMGRFYLSHLFFDLAHNMGQGFEINKDAFLSTPVTLSFYVDTGSGKYYMKLISEQPHIEDRDWAIIKKNSNLELSQLGDLQYRPYGDYWNKGGNGFILYSKFAEQEPAALEFQRTVDGRMQTILWVQIDRIPEASEFEELLRKKDLLASSGVSDFPAILEGQIDSANNRLVASSGMSPEAQALINGLNQRVRGFSAQEQAQLTSIRKFIFNLLPESLSSKILNIWDGQGKLSQRVSIIAFPHQENQAISALFKAAGIFAQDDNHPEGLVLPLINGQGQPIYYLLLDDAIFQDPAKLITTFVHELFGHIIADELYGQVEHSSAEIRAYTIEQNILNSILASQVGVENLLQAPAAQTGITQADMIRRAIESGGFEREINSAQYAISLYQARQQTAQGNKGPTSASSGVEEEIEQYLNTISFDSRMSFLLKRMGPGAIVEVKDYQPGTKETAFAKQLISSTIKYRNEIPYISSEEKVSDIYSLVSSETLESRFTDWVVFGGLCNNCIKGTIRAIIDKASIGATVRVVLPLFAINPQYLTLDGKRWDYNQIKELPDDIARHSRPGYINSGARVLPGIGVENPYFVLPTSPDDHVMIRKDGKFLKLIESNTESLGASERRTLVLDFYTDPDAMLNYAFMPSSTAASLGVVNFPATLNLEAEGLGADVKPQLEREVDLRDLLVAEFRYQFSQLLFRRLLVLHDVKKQNQVGALIEELILNAQKEFRGKDQEFHETKIQLGFFSGKNGNFYLKFTLKQPRIGDERWAKIQANAKLDLEQLKDYLYRNDASLFENAGGGFRRYAHLAEVQPTLLQFDKSEQGELTTTLWTKINKIPSLEEFDTIFNSEKPSASSGVANVVSFLNSKYQGAELENALMALHFMQESEFFGEEVVLHAFNNSPEEFYRSLAYFYWVPHFQQNLIQTIKYLVEQGYQVAELQEFYTSHSLNFISVINFLSQATAEGKFTIVSIMRNGDLLNSLLANSDKKLYFRVMDVATLNAVKGLIHIFKIKPQNVKIVYQPVLGLNESIVKEWLPGFEIKEYDPNTELESNRTLVGVSLLERADSPSWSKDQAVLTNRFFKYELPIQTPENEGESLRQAMTIAPGRKVIVASLLQNPQEIRKVLDSIQQWDKSTRPLLILGLRVVGDPAREIVKEYPALKILERSPQDQTADRLFNGLAEGQAMGNADVVLLNTMGELYKLYAAADLAILGNDRNFMEPVSQGKGAIFLEGSSDHNFEVRDFLSKSGAIVGAEQDLFGQINQLFIHPEQLVEFHAKAVYARDQYLKNSGNIARFFNSAALAFAINSALGTSTTSSGVVNFPATLNLEAEGLGADVKPQLERDVDLRSLFASDSRSKFVKQLLEDANIRGRLGLLIEELILNATRGFVANRQNYFDTKIQLGFFSGNQGKTYLKLALKQPTVGDEQWARIQGNAKLGVAQLKNIWDRGKASLRQNGGAGFATYAMLAEVQPALLQFEKSERGELTTTLWSEIASIPTEQDLDQVFRPALMKASSGVGELNRYVFDEENVLLKVIPNDGQVLEDFSAVENKGSLNYVFLLPDRVVRIKTPIGALKFSEEPAMKAKILETLTQGGYFPGVIRYGHTEGSNPREYMETMRVVGQDLFEFFKQLDVDPQVRQQIESEIEAFFTFLNDNKIYISDAYGLRNFMWGRKSGESKDHLLFVDPDLIYSADRLVVPSMPLVEQKRQLLQRIKYQMGYYKEGGESTRQDVGGIDLNPNQLNLDLRGSAEGFSLPTDLKDFDSIHFDGLVPHIIQMNPMSPDSFMLFWGRTASDPLPNSALSRS